MNSSEETIAALRRADENLADARAAVEEVGTDDIERVADACERLHLLLDRYEGRATGTGDFPAFVEFQEKVSTLVEELPDDLPERETFEEIDELLGKRRLSEADFDRTRDALAPVEAIADRRERQREARENYRNARRAVEAKLSSVRAKIADLEGTLELGDADLDAPVEELREPIEAYNDAVREAFAQFRSTASAREVLDLVTTAQSYPLVGFRSPPDDLQSYVAETAAGERTIPKLLDLADYSSAKLSHHVDDPRELKRHVATNRTYLERLDGDPLTLGWPPQAATRLRWRIEELIAVCNRFAPDEPIVRLRELRGYARKEDEYERLRTAARARLELTREERERLQSGAIEADLDAAREARERLEDALDETGT